MFCGYANGLIAYTREIASRTEQFWCPIKHAQEIRDPHARSRDYADYGDPDAYSVKLKALRTAISESAAR